jgi:hypothetical protein
MNACLATQFVDPFGRENMRFLGTNRRAIAAIGALVTQKRQLRKPIATLRIVAPKTSQWTSLQKYSRTYSRAIVNGKTLDVNQSGCRI